MTAQSDALVAELEKRVARVASELVLEIDKELRTLGTGTPVDTGHARRNWVPSVATPWTGIATSDGPHNAGVAAVLHFRLRDGDLFLANNVDYVAFLNLGSSKQAPYGFIEACIDRADATIRSRHIDVSMDVTEGLRAASSEAGAAAAEGLAASYSPFGSD